MKLKLTALLTLIAAGAWAQNTLPAPGATNAFTGQLRQVLSTNVESPFLTSEGVPLVHIGHQHSNYWRIVTVKREYWLDFSYVAAGQTNTDSKLMAEIVVAKKRQEFSVAPLQTLVNREEDVE